MNAKSTDRWAAIDFGPETVHLLVGKVRRTSQRREVRHVDSRARYLGDETSPRVATRRISGSTAGEIATVVGRYLLLAERAGARPLVAATDAITWSPDASAVLAKVEATTGQPVRVLSPARESQLGLLASASFLDAKGAQLVVDCRNGSIDVSLAAGREIVSTNRLAIGAAALAALLPGDPPSPLEWGLEAVRGGAQLAALPYARPFQAIVTGEAAHLLVNFDAVRAEKTPAKVSLADLDRLSDEALSSSTRKTARRTGDDPRRVALLAPGALLLGAILQRYGLERCIVVPAGLRDGMILAADGNAEGWWREPMTAESPVEMPAPAPSDAAAGSNGTTPEPAADGATNGSKPPSGRSRPRARKSR